MFTDAFTTLRARRGRVETRTGALGKSDHGSKCITISAHGNPLPTLNKQHALAKSRKSYLFQACLNRKMMAPRPGVAIFGTIPSLRKRLIYHPNYCHTALEHCQTLFSYIPSTSSASRFFATATMGSTGTSSLPSVYIVSAVRTPIGQFQGCVRPPCTFDSAVLIFTRALASQTAIQLGSHTIKCTSSSFAAST